VQMKRQKKQLEIPQVGSVAWLKGAAKEEKRLQRQSSQGW
jgi:hypothetical protein